MQITKNAVALIEFELKDDEGEVLDSSKGGDPLAYIHGVGQLIPRLEEKLAGKSDGDELEVFLQPEDGYGVRVDELVQTVSRGQFPEDAEIRVGMQFQAESEAGMQVVTVVDVEGDDVTLDGNHPLAGIPLHFALKVLSVREATAEELDHGHVHGPGDDDH